MRQALLLGVLAVLVALAGCGADQPTATTTASVTTTAGDGATATTTTSDVTTTTPASAGLTQDGVLSAHRSALRAAGSFNATQTVVIETNDTSSAFQRIALTTRYGVDYEQDRAIERTAFLGETVTYTAGETTYERSAFGDDVPDEEATYDVSTGDGGAFRLEPVNRTEAEGELAVVVDNVTYQRAGTATVDGVTVTVYEARGVEAIENYEDVLGAEADPETEGNATLSDFRATLRIDEDGIIRSAAWSLTVVDEERIAYTIGVEYTVSHVGDASIEVPAWVPLAEERASETGQQDCEPPSAAGEFGQSRAADGTYTVEFTVTSIGDESVLRLEHNDATAETAFDRTAYFAGSVATTTGLSPGDEVRAVAETFCGETEVVGTYTVRSGDSSA